MATIPSIAMIPSGYKANKVYSVLPTDGSGDLDSARTTTARRINSDGLIEEVAIGVPRLDYTDGSCPSLLLEPASTNLITQSEAFDNAYWTKGGATVTSGFSSPSVDSPLGAFKANKLGSSSNDRIKADLTITLGVSYSVSVFLKNDTIAGTTTIASRITGGTLFRLGFDWNGETPSISASHSSGTRTNEIIENYGNGWYRLGFSFLSDGTDLDIEIDLDRTNATDTTSLFTWGAQLEAQSSATSYIPTAGTIISRTAESASKSGISSLINSSEGVLYFEGNALGSNQIARSILINDTTSNNELGFYYYGNRIDVYVKVNGVSTFFETIIITDATENAKMALKFKENDFSFWLNGSKVASDTDGLVPLNISYLSILEGLSVKDLRIYNKILSDAELTTLTTL